MFHIASSESVSGGDVNELEGLLLDIESDECLSDSKDTISESEEEGTVRCMYMYIAV